ncbi:MAG TPA: calcium/sodium antiporter [Geopsychrobacteraceae bacterium]|nr:calcium/sodium antiporter [Geopsychrobacteraceae bacterium]
MLTAVILFFAGLMLLYFGAEYMVSGSSRFALSLGIRPLIIGMTIVALATSMPEMMVSLTAVLKGTSDIAAGNIIGSNIANIGLILGAAALLAPMTVAKSTLKKDIPIMLAASLLLVLFALDGQLGFVDGLLLVIGLVIFILYCVFGNRRQGSSQPADEKAVALEKRHRSRDLVLILVGIVGLGVGAELMVRSAITIAQSFGISDMIIGMTVVALGTSLPELAASMMGAWKGEMDLSVGNVIGSNIFNLLFVLGVCSMIRPIAIESSILRFELPIMLLFSFALLPLIGRRMRIGRTEGGILLVAYLSFVGIYFFQG